MMKWKLDEFARAGFANLLRPFENSLDDIIKTTRAFGMATRAHLGQFRYESRAEPYINHPLKVALILTEELKIYDVNLVCAALLHDVIEKRDENKSLTEDEIKKEAGEYVYSIVRALDKPKIVSEERERLLNEYFERMKRASKAIRYVKLADELDNLRSLKNSVHKNMILRYKEEVERYVVPIAEKTDEKLLFKLSIALYELK
jgi:(p)ppGpp synthase/HD superfamily hydrolase